jgi:hypothetical protein
MENLEIVCCNACEAHRKASEAGAPSGRYQLTCLDCCVRLVDSARPSKRQAAGMLAAIARQPGSPKRADILKALKG